MFNFTKDNKIDFALILTGAAGLVFSFPKVEIGWLAYPALAILCYLGIRPAASQNKLFMTGHSSPPHDGKSRLPPKEESIPLQYFHGKRFLPGFIFGLLFYLGNIYWVSHSMENFGQLPILASWSVLVLLCAYLALYFGFFTWGINRLSSRGALIWTAPFYWVALEYIRTYLLSGLPWSLIGYSQYKYIPLIQVADITGVYGVSFIVLSVAVSLAKLAALYPDIKPGEVIKYGLPAFFLPALVMGYGYYQLGHLKFPEKIRIAVAQGNVDQAVKWNPVFQQQTLDKYKELSRKAAQKSPALIVWPETSAPFYFQTNRKFASQIRELARELKTPLLFGAPAFELKDGEYRQQNSAFLLSSSGKQIGKSDKIHLVPFGEYVPLGWLLKSLGTLVAEVGDFSPGEKPEILKIDRHRFGAVICFEIIFPDLVRQFFMSGGDFMVTITNDAWFGRTSAAFQHYAITAFRAVENHAGIARSANTGISGFYDPFGRNISSTDIFTTTQITADLPLNQGKTFYTRYGDIFSWFCCFVAFGGLLGIKIMTGPTSRKR